MTDHPAEVQAVGGSQDAQKAKEALQPLVLENKEEPPRDFKNLVYLIVLFHGIGTLLPWNAFMTIGHSYYTGYKMRNIVHDGNVTRYEPTSLSENFMHYQLIAAQTPNLIFNLLNIFAASYFRMDILKTVTSSLSVVAAVIVVTMSFIYVNTWPWMNTFFWITILSIAVLNGANGLYQNCIFGLASELPFRYTNAVIIGNNICGTFVTIVSIFTGLSGDVQASAMIFFGIALGSLVICFISIFFLRQQEFYRFYSRQAELRREADTEQNGRPELSDYLDTLKEGAPQFLNVFLVFFVTLTIFPGIMLDITPNGKGEKYDFILPESQYSNFVVFLLFNVFSFIGSLFAGYKQLPKPNKLWIPVFIRLLLIPFFIFCNYKVNDRTLPVFFPSVYVYITVAIIMSLSNGYFSGISMMYANTTVEPSKQRIAGTMAAFFLIFGIFSGLLTSLAIKTIIA